MEEAQVGNLEETLREGACTTPLKKPPFYAPPGIFFSVNLGCLFFFILQLIPGLGSPDMGLSELNCGLAMAAGQMHGGAGSP